MSDLVRRLQDALVDRYRIERVLGQGGFATVFLAEDLKHPRHVAIKVLDPEVAAGIGPERFLREIETVAALQHPHIVPLHDSGVADGLLYYVMPFVEGESLRDRMIREKQLPVDDALRITREVADALGHAHRQGVVHRDIKPENILIEEQHALVADFGIARATGTAGREKLTATGVSVGTPVYMSPEQAAGGPTDSRSDIYGLGCVLYEMLAGQPPFSGPTAESVLYQHLNAAPPRVMAIRPSVPAGLDPVITKALAKTPADRYGSAAEFDAALSSALTADAPPAPTIRRRRLVWAGAAATGVVVAMIAVAAWQEWGPFAGRHVGPPAKKDWILVAEFDGAPEDSAVAMASHDLLSAALDQSKIVATVTPDQIREALRMAGKPANSRVGPELARELAYRSSVRSVLEGKIGRLGPAYSIVLRLVDADSARVILTENGVAKNEDELVSRLGSLARKLRAGLGENRRTLAATREMTLVATPSFEAYRLYVQALRLFRAQMAGRKTLGLLRAAVALDPDFATAWTFMGIVYSDLAYPDSARACFDRSWSRPDRLTDVQRRRLEVLRMTNDGDSRGALAACDQMLADDPNDWWALINSNDLLVVAGRIEEALQRTRTSMKVSPFGATTLSRSNLVTDLVLLTRFDEAREAASHMTGVYRANFLYFVERGANRWTVAESIAVCNLDDPRVNEDFPGLFLWLLGQTQLARGDLQVAKATLARSVAMSVAAQDAAGVKWDRLLLVEYAVVSSQALPLPPDAELRDTSATSVLTRGLAATATGDLAVARRSLAGLRSRSAQALALQGAGPTLLEARIAMLAAQPADAVELLRPLAVARVDPGFPGVGVGLTWIRWSLADAFERLAKPDSAAAYLERVMSVPTDTEVWPFVHLRLTLLYARMGRVAEAERHLAAVESTWDRPEPAVRRMLNDARAAVTSARGMARPEAAGANVVAPDSGSRDVRGPGH